MGDVADVVKMAEVDLAKRMGENIGRAFKISDEGNTRASNITYKASGITRMEGSSGRYSMAESSIE